MILQRLPEASHMLASTVTDDDLPVVRAPDPDSSIQGIAAAGSLGAGPSVGSGVVDGEGLFGTVVSHHAMSQDAARAGLSSMVVVRHREQQVMLPAGLFEAVSATSFRIPFAFSALIAQGSSNGKLVIPVMQEEMAVGKRLVDTGRGVRVHKTVIETPHVVEQSLQEDQLHIEHVTQDTWIDPDHLPVARQEGDTLIIPVIEEVLVVRTRLRLKEEVRITRTSRPVIGKETVFLKTQQVQVERFDENLGTPGRQPTQAAGREPGA